MGGGFWNASPELGHYRLINQTLKCHGSKLIVCAEAAVLPVTLLFEHPSVGSQARGRQTKPWPEAEP